MISSRPATAPGLSGADLIIHLLERQGVTIVAGIPGGALLPLYEALARTTRIRHILARHEQAAGFIAQGMSRITGKAGVCFATSGPGVTNMVTALADARLDSIPLVCICGQVPTTLIGTDAFQEVATIDMVRPITKACFFVRHANELWRVIPEAFHLAQSGRPGPVLIDVPKDVQLQLADSESHCMAPAHASMTPAATDSPWRPGAVSILDNHRHFDLAAQMIHAAQRPVLYVGGGVVKARAHEAIRQLAERASLPVTSTLMARGCLPAGHALDIGMLGMHGARYTNLIIDECDLLIAVGARFDDRATGDPRKFAPHARVIHIDIDPREFGKIRAAELCICAGADMAARELLERVPPTQRTLWLARVNQLKQSHPLRTPGIQKVCSPYGIVRAVGTLAPADVIVTTDVGQHQMWVAQLFPLQRPDRWLTSGGLGTMGFGLPAAIGAALAAPDATTVCFTGDGSLLMNVQELATLAELDLNVKIVLLDNAALGLVRQQQELFYRQRYVASSYSRPSQFVAIARAFDIPAFDLGEAHDPHAALSCAFARRDPVLIRVPIAATEHVLPMVAPGAGNVDALDHAPQYAEES
jgi:acetolactate synthase-1/2/3 large subunit